MRLVRLSAVVLICIEIISLRSGTILGVCGIIDSDLDIEATDCPALSLLQRSARLTPKENVKVVDAEGSDAAGQVTSTQMATTMATTIAQTTYTTGTTSTTTTTDVGPSYFIASSRTTGAIYSWSTLSAQPGVLIPNAGSNPTGIALDHNRGYIYYSDPGARQIVRYELCFRDGEMQLYDDQPVPIAVGVDAEWIAVNDLSNLFWTDPVNHSIKKMYFTTIDAVAAGSIQPTDLTVVPYMDIYRQLDKVPSACYDETVFPSTCYSNASCSACQQLHLQGYIYELYSNVGTPAGIQQMPGPGNLLLWGNRYNGFTNGSVVRAEAEPSLMPNQTSFPITPISYLWDQVFNFIQLPDTALGQGTLFITTNGTLGTPPIPGDVVGAIVAIPPDSDAGPSEAIVLDWNLDQPRQLAWNGHSKLYFADNAGIKYINPQMLDVGLLSSLETTEFALPGTTGLIQMLPSAPCYPLMVAKGSIPLPTGYG